MPMKTLAAILLLLSTTTFPILAERFQVETLERPEDNLFVFLRFDTETGSIAKLARGEKPSWESLPSPKPDSKGPFRLAAKVVGKIPILLIIEEQSGETWILGADGWESVSKEKEELPKSQYALTIAEVKGSFEAFRTDLKTGSSWMMKGDKWIAIKQ